jgi:histidinol phosphatase-like enzyme (inositol monophosphatase family)
VKAHTTTGSEMLFAIEVCQAAGTVAMDYLRQGIVADTKADGSPVTKADKECERLIIDKIVETFPDDGILGEEHGERRATEGNRRWIIDPIDGTYNYARGIPIFATLLALEYDGEVVLGVVHAPAMLETFWAEHGRGAFKNGLKTQVSNCNKVSESMLNFGGANRILQFGFWEGFTKLVAETKKQRGFGDYLGFSLVFEGKSEAMIEIEVMPWDLAPMKILIEESGGRFSDLEGGASIYSGSCLVSNGLVHDQIETTLLENKRS